MGCSETKAPHSEVKNPIQELLQILSDEIKKSRKNLKYFEPTYYFFNLIMQQSFRKNNLSKSILDELLKFKLELPKFLQEPKINEVTFLKHLLLIESSFNVLYRESGINFDLRSQINKNESLSNSLNKDESFAKLLNDFFLNEPAEFWFKNFHIPNENGVISPNISWPDFLNKFEKSDYMTIFKKDLENLPEDKKPNSTQILENILLLIKYELQSNNDLNVTRDGWNSFSFRYLSNFSARDQLVQKASVSAKPPTNILGLNLTIFFEEAFSENKLEYEISPDNFKDPQGTTNINMLHDYFRAGRNKGKNEENQNESNNLIFDNKKCEEVSRFHFKITLKRTLQTDQTINEYYMNNISRQGVYFIVEEQGYLLAKNMIVNFSNLPNDLFHVTDLYPPFQPNSQYLSIEPQFLGTQRELDDTKSVTPFIEFEISGSTERKTVESDKQDYEFTIGNEEDDGITVPDDDFVFWKNHCYIKYDSKNRCWVIQDRTIFDTNPENEDDKGPHYKTLLKCHNKGQYDNVGDMQNFIMRGIKLVDKMKIFVGKQLLEVVEK